MEINWKKSIPHIVVLALLLIISIVYFYPAITGYSLETHDVQMFQGMAKELIDYREANGEEALWANNMFSGMPATQVSVVHKGNLMGYVYDVITLWMPRPISILWMYFLGFYILLMCLKVNPWIALIGCIAYGFSSYFIVILDAGHMSKANAIGMMAPVIGGIWLSFRGELIKGGLITMLFFALELWANHLQITYYMFFIIAAVGIGESIRLIAIGKFSYWYKTVGVLTFAALIGVAVNIPNLWGTVEYTKYSTRGKTELTISSTGEEKSDRKKDGLELDYITEYSYGLGETFTFAVADTKGGATGSTVEYIQQNNIEITPEFQQTLNRIGDINKYFGDQRITSGPVYIGAVVLVLALLALIFAADWVVYSLLFVTVITVMLAWGKNLMGFTEFFVNYFPGYAKFRAVTMILVVAEFCLPFIGVIFLKKLIDNRDEIKAKIKSFYITSGVVLVGFLLIISTPDSFFNFLSSSERMSFDVTRIEIENDANLSPQDKAMYISVLESSVPPIKEFRKTEFRKDAKRSLFFIIVSLVLILLYINKKIESTVLGIGMAIFILIDVGGVAKRYLNNEKDVTGEYLSWKEKEKELLAFDAMYVDYAIKANEVKTHPELQEKITKAITEAQAEKGEALTLPERESVEFSTLNANTNYKVFSQIESTFNSTRTSYFHKSIGGYHGAKLKKYQEMIEFHIGRKNEKVLDMLNTKYIIGQTKSPYTGKDTIIYQERQTALGNAWIVNDVKYVENADEEMLAMNKYKGFNPAEVTIIDKRYKDKVGQFSPRTTDATIQMISYAPNKLSYSFNSSANQLVVFSEIFYEKGWKATIDGKPADIFRTNYILRGLNVPAGKHEIVFEYSLKSYSTGNTIALIASLITIGLVVLGVYFSIKKKELISKFDLKEVLDKPTKSEVA